MKKNITKNGKGSFWPIFGGCLFLVGVVCIILVCVLPSFIELSRTVEIILVTLAAIGFFGGPAILIICAHYTPGPDIPCENYLDPLERQETGYHGKLM